MSPSACKRPHRYNSRPARGFWRMASALWTVILLTIAIALAPQVQAAPDGAGWQEFQGTWTAVGHRQGIVMGGSRRASVGDFHGSIMLSGPSRPAIGFHAEAIVMLDTATGMIGRAVWTDDRGDHIYSELRGEGTMTGNRIIGMIIGGTGRFAGVTGGYEFAWRFQIEGEDGLVQGQSVGLKGWVRAASASGDPAR